MEDDDEFGDLYTDFLRPFESSEPLSSSAPQPHQSSAAPQSFHCLIDPKVLDEEEKIHFVAPHPNPSVSHPPNSQTLAPAASVPTAPVSGSKVLEAKDVELPKANSVDLNIGGKDLDLTDNDVNFDIEEANNGAVNSERRAPPRFEFTIYVPARYPPEFQLPAPTSGSRTCLPSPNLIGTTRFIQAIF
ncbi:hypothetical protein COP2_024221 [Malus domestica]